MALCAGLALAIAKPTAKLRLATWNVELERAGPGLLLRDILSGKDAQVRAAIATLLALRADILLLIGFDFDHELIAAGAFASQLQAAGLHYPYLFAQRPNHGMATGLDLDGDGQLGGAGDAQGFGWFPGQEGMLVLSRLPILRQAAQDYSDFLWADLPDALLPPDLTPEARQLQRLSSSGHWSVPILLPDGRQLSLLCWHATPPVFDGPEDRNGRRNHDETAFWLALLEWRLPLPPPPPPYVVLGTANLDPADGEGRPAALRRLLQQPMLYDAQPRARPATADTPPGEEARPPPLEPMPGAAQTGDPALDTAHFPQLGGLRLEVILASRDLAPLGSGMLRQPFAKENGAKNTSRHHPIWLDIAITQE